jgi:hypothetical protein
MSWVATGPEEGEEDGSAAEDAEKRLDDKRSDITD